ncbi:amino acid ABC transporter permease [Pseudonocardia acaciae]|uniref:amino acid ABC transporter permease n=1 Tax=Pseudonocardia acaciae TaxID=551276 RepID=UPI000687A37D|nr:amino acid ABC transporter permease [Pseudonocardia acaciae]
MAETFLFDAPGPRARRRIRAATAVTVLVLAGALVVVLANLGTRGQLDADRWAVFTEWPVQRFLLRALGSTLMAAAVAGAVSFPLAVLVALARLSAYAPLSRVATAYVELFRAIPLLLVIYVFLLGLPVAGVQVPPFWQLTLSLIIHNTAVLAEIVRAGILALDRGQVEAAQALGMTRAQTMASVVIPQVLRALAPALLSQLVALLKDTTLGYVVSYPELLDSAKVLGEYTSNLLPTYLTVAALYVALNLLLSWLARVLERRRRAPPTIEEEDQEELPHAERAGAR